MDKEQELKRGGEKERSEKSEKRTGTKERDKRKKGRKEKGAKMGGGKGEYEAGKTIVSVVLSPATLPQARTYFPDRERETEREREECRSRDGDLPRQPDNLCKNVDVYGKRKVASKGETEGHTWRE